MADNVKRKMLVVDDEEVNRSILKTIFEDRFDVLEASGGGEAIKIIESDPEISVLLLDIVMPLVTGYDVLLFLKKNGYLQKFPAVIISGLDDVQSRGKLYDLGASDIITKPFIPDVVSQRVGSVLDFFSKSFSGTDERRAVLITDDMAMNRAIISEIFYKDYEIIEACDGQEAIEILTENSDKLAAVILDVLMPRKSGFDVIEFMRDKNYLEDIPVVFITAMEKPENELRIWNLGASDVISKPFLPHIVKKRVENVVSLYRNKRRMSQMLEYLERKQDFFNNELVDVLSSLIEYRSLESGKHIMRIRQYSKILLTELVKSSPDYFLDNETILTIADATAMHDIGKIIIPDTVLNKAGKLTKEEFEIIKQHPAVGSQILSRLLGSDMNEYMRYAYDICRYHHERWDGRGYPDGLIANEIPIWAQVASIADVYDALTTDRVYKPAFDHQAALNMILNGECGQFSPILLECLSKAEREISDAAKLYRDGLSPRSEQYVSMSHKSAKIAKNRSTQTAIYKYFAMLQLTGDVVFELNLDTGEHHLVYPLIVVNNIIRENGKFFEEMNDAINRIVHPDDREIVHAGLEAWKKRIGSGVLTPEPVDCRIYVPKEDNYHWYKITFKNIIGDIEGENFALVRLQDFGSAADINKNVGEFCSRLALLDQADGRQTVSPAGDRTLEFIGYFGDCIAEYDILNGLGTFYYNDRKVVLPLRKGGDYLTSFIHRDDLKLYKEHLSRLLLGNEVEDIRFRMNTGKDEYRRKWKRSILIRDDDGNPVKAISSVVDADRLLSHVDDVRIKSQIDQMTGSFNKAMAEHTVSQILAQSGKNDRHAMMVIDIDDFKLVNDTFGHLMGDEVLKAVSHRLATIFTGGPMVGRIGGDEFIVFVKNCGDEEEITKHIQSLYYNLSEIKLKNNVSISISCGVAKYPTDGTDYVSLFESADKALYQAKTKGKARFCFAESGGEDHRPSPKTLIESEIGHDKDFYDMLSHMLLDMDDSKEAIESVFNFTARNMMLSSIVATGRGDAVLYEWQADTSYRPYSRVCGALGKLNYTVGIETKDGVIVCSDVDNLDPIITSVFKEEGVGSFLAMETGDTIFKQGYIIFSAREKGRLWRGDEIRIVRLIARMFSLLHAKTFAEMQSRESQQVMDAIFGAKEDYTFVVDESFHIVRADSKTKEKFKNCEGEYCYGVINKNTSPCPNCPVFSLNSETTEASAEVYSRKLGRTLKVTAVSPKSEQDKKLTIVSIKK